MGIKSKVWTHYFDLNLSELARKPAEDDIPRLSGMISPAVERSFKQDDSLVDTSCECESCDIPMYELQNV